MEYWLSWATGNAGGATQGINGGLPGNRARPEDLGRHSHDCLVLSWIGTAPDGFDNPPLVGTPTQIAKAMLRYDQAGVEHVMFHLIPYKPAAIRKFEQALSIYRQLSDEKRLKKAI